MYRHADEPFEPEHEAELPQPHGRRFAPVPLGLFGSLLALGAEFFGLFLIGWGLAPTSIGCGVNRAFGVSGAALALAGGIYVIFVGVGLGIMREARETDLRKRHFLVTFTACYAIGSLPLLAIAALMGSCFDF
jgi:hypothetical protein